MQSERAMILIAVIFMSCLTITISIINSRYEREDMADLLDRARENHTLLLQQQIKIEKLELKLKEYNSNVELGLVDFMSAETISLLKLEVTDE